MRTQSVQTITDDPAPSHLTREQIQFLACQRGALAYDLGVIFRVVRGSFHRDFAPTADGLFRAAPIRSWLGV